MWEGGWAKWVKGIKESTPEIIVALYANLDVNFKIIKKKKKKKGRKNCIHSWVIRYRKNETG